MAESFPSTLHPEWGDTGQGLRFGLLSFGEEGQAYILQDIFVHHALGRAAWPYTNYH